jgi:two-component system chemotaxis response regulator CheY
LAVRAIKDYDPAARIIMCSALGQQTLIHEALEAGALDFITKPFTPQKILSVAEMALSTPE